MEQINAAFLRLPKAEVRRLLSKREELSVKHGMSMFTPKGKVRIIQVHLRPWGIDPAQQRFFYRTCMILRGALDRLLPLYLSDPKVQRILPLEPVEREWILSANARRLQQPQAVVDRLDTTATFTPSDWKRNFWFLEPNSVGIGGVHYIPATCELTAEWVLPTLKRALPDLQLEFQDDIRILLLKLFRRHAKGIGRRLKRVALIEDQSVNGGTDEFTSVAGFFRRQGLAAITADPRDVLIRKDELTVKGKPVDLLYRDSEITEILEMGGGAQEPVAGIREAFVRNQVISSIAGEFDHKSCWELFTNPEFAGRFTLRQRRLFKDHLLWTRLLWDRKTAGPRGKAIDLIPFVRRNRETLVLKPNREYGGEGVVFGHQVSQSLWERELVSALKRPFTHVIQQSAPVRAELFPVAEKDGTVRLEPYYAVTGFAVSRDGMAILGRASKEAIVNVSRKGGLIAIWKLA